MSAAPPDPSSEPTATASSEPTATASSEPTATPRPTSLGQQLEALRARRPAVIRTAPPRENEHDRSIGRALGAGLGLLATFIAAIAFAFVTSRLVGGMYVTFAMPVFVGTLIASVASIGPRRFRFAERRPLVLMMIAGAIVCWLGQHLLAYARVCELVAAQSAIVASGDLADRGLALIEQATGQSGVVAYLTYISSGPAASLSPIGYLGRIEPGVAGTVLIALVELGLMAATGAWSILYRTRHLRRVSGPIAFFDAAAAARAGAALQGKRFDELAVIIAGSTGLTSHALAVEEGESAAEATIWELDAAGQLGARTSSRLLPIEAVGDLRAALARARDRNAMGSASAPAGQDDRGPENGGSDAARHD